MDLRAFLNIKSGFIFRLFAGCILFFFTLTGLRGQTVTVDPKVPYEIRFAGITFQLSDVARYLLSQEIAYLDKNPQIRQDYLNKLSLYLPVIEPVIDKAGVPEDFKFLSIYSRFQKSVSVVSVTDPGVFWCLDKIKATEVGLKMDEEIDERKHLTISTTAALAGLKRNYNLYNSWATALFAQIADRSVVKTLDVAKKWNGNRFVVIDSPAYSSLIHFLAYKSVMERDWPAFRPEQQAIIYQYPYGKGKSLNLIAADLQVEPQTLVEYNKWLKVNKVPDEADVIVVVQSSRYHEIRKLGELSRNLGIAGYESGFPVLTESPGLNKGKGGSFYLINGKKGIRADYCDSHVSLAYKSGISLKRFLSYNEMTEKEVTAVGQVYYLEEKNGKAAIPFHIVKEGETIWYIAQMYGVKTPVLLDYNRMNTVQRLQNGRVIWLQKKMSKKRQVEFVELPKDEIHVLEEKPLAVREAVEQLPAEKVMPVIPEQAEISAAEPEKKTVREVTDEKKVVKKEPEPEKIEVIRIPVTKESSVAKTPPQTVETPLKKTQGKKQEPAKPLKSTEEYPEGTEVKDGYVYHVVKKGETLYRVSVNYKVSVEKLYRLNNLRSNTIEIGDWIKVRPI